MKKSLCWLVVISLGILYSASLCAESPKRKPTKSDKFKFTPAPAEIEYADARFYRYKTNVLLGIHILRSSSALVSGVQMGFAPLPSTPLYIGPEVNFSLFSPGSILSVLGGGWYELRIYGSPRLSVLGGVVGGPGFSTGLDNIPTTSFVVFLDTAIIQEINDLASVRGQLRPGIVNGNFAFMVNFNVSFRFQ